MFYPLDPLPPLFRWIAYANPITWQVDIFRYATLGLGSASVLLLEALGFVIFTGDQLSHRLASAAHAGVSANDGDGLPCVRISASR